MCMNCKCTTYITSHGKVVASISALVSIHCGSLHINSFLPEQNGRHFSDDIFKHIFLNANVRIVIKISLKFIPNGPIDNKSALV